MDKGVVFYFQLLGWGQFNLPGFNGPCHRLVVLIEVGEYATLTLPGLFDVLQLLVLHLQNGKQHLLECHLLLLVALSLVLQILYKHILDVVFAEVVLLHFFFLGSCVFLYNWTELVSDSPLLLQLLVLLHQHVLHLLPVTHKLPQQVLQLHF